MNLLSTVEDLKESYQQCRACPLGEERIRQGENLVFGVGPVPARGMIIGESPGPEEEKHIMPFYSKAPCGEKLDDLMKMNRLIKEEWFITNAVICAPLDSTRKYVMDSPNKKLIFGSHIGDDKAISKCNTRLKMTMDLVEPDIVVLLGAAAFTAVFGKNPPAITPLLGWQSRAGHNYRIFVSYHPSFYVRRKDFFLKNSHEGDSDYEQKLKEITDLSDLYINHWEQIADAYNDF